MGIEGQVKFLGKIPLTTKDEMPEGFWPKNNLVFLKVWLLNLVSLYTPILEHNETITVSTDDVSVPKHDDVVVFSKDEINKARVSLPTLFPGVKIHLSHKP